MIGITFFIIIVHFIFNTLAHGWIGTKHFHKIFLSILISSKIRYLKKEKTIVLSNGDKIYYTGFSFFSEYSYNNKIRIFKYSLLHNQIKQIIKYYD